MTMTRSIAVIILFCWVIFSIPVPILTGVLVDYSRSRRR